MSMEIVLEIPDDVIAFPGSSVNDLSREALEAYAYQPYLFRLIRLICRDQRMTGSQLRRVTGFCDSLSA